MKKFFKRNKNRRGFPLLFIVVVLGIILAGILFCLAGSGGVNVAFDFNDNLINYQFS